ncbi:DUF2959 family protein [Pseudomonas sp. Marseille-QA0892]
MRAFSIAFLFLLLTGCKSFYYDALEHTGIHKRDLLVQRIEKVRDAQAEAQKQFETTLLEYRSVVLFQSGDLNKRQAQLEQDYRAAQLRARNVRYHLQGVDSVADDLFAEWKAELRDYRSPQLRQAAEGDYDRTRQQYEALREQLNGTEARFEPLLDLLGDQMLSLRHSLNARAVSQSNDAYTRLEEDMKSLFEEMTRANNQADMFIRRLRDRTT